MSQVGVNFARSCRDSSPDHRPPSVTPEPAATSGSHRELSSGHPPKPESESESGREAPALSNVTTGAPVRLARASRRRYAALVPTARPLKSWSVCRKGLRKTSPPRQVTNRLGLPAVEGLLHRPSRRTTSVRAGAEVVDPSTALAEDPRARHADVVVTASKPVVGTCAADEGRNARTTRVARRRQAGPYRGPLNVESNTSALTAIRLRAIARWGARLPDAWSRRRAGPRAAVRIPHAAARPPTGPSLRRRAISRRAEVASAVAFLGTSAAHDRTARRPWAFSISASETQGRTARIERRKCRGT